LSDRSEALPEVARFLREYPPFDALDIATVERVAASAEVEFHRAGETIVAQRGEPVDYLRVVRSGAVELVHDGRVLDLMGPGELFGHESMLSGLPPDFEARAAEDTLCYSIDAEVASAVLAAPAGVRFVARSLAEVSEELAGAATDRQPDPAHQPVGALIRSEPVICEPTISIREAVRLMTAAGASAVVVRLDEGRVGIVTDRDLRTRVLAAGVATDAPVCEVMSAPAYACSPDRLGGELLLEMLDRGFRHFPVLSVTGEILGVVEDVDIVAGQTRSSFFLRQRIGRARSIEELVELGGDLRAFLIAMHDTRLASTTFMSVYGVVVDALTRRLIELAVQEAGGQSVEFAWLALGSQARREMSPSADLDSAIVWFGEVEEAAVRPWLHGVAQQVVAALERCGLRADERGASASNILFVRSLASWQRAARSWIADPTQEKALLLTSVLVDSRPVWGVHMGTPVTDTFRSAQHHSALLRMLARFALSYHPPTGFLRGLVVEHGGEHRGRLDLKYGGVLPIVDLARWAGMAAGVTSASTLERLRAAGAAGALPEADAHTLQDAFHLISDLRLSHQVRQLRVGEEPDNHVDPAALSPLMRSQLKDAFRAVASIQRRIASELHVGVR
jgi:CBS domain-containing protein